MDWRTLKVRSEVLGKSFKTNNSGTCFVFEYNNYQDVLVMFHEPSCIVSCSMSNLKKGKVDNPIKPVVYNIGYSGIGLYNSTNSRRYYGIWNNMLERCYSKTTRHKFPTYKDVTVCREWWDFQNFAKWCDTAEFVNSRDDNGRYYHLDKDILSPASKEYSPKDCCFVPSYINTLFTKRQNSDLPVGVSPDKLRGGYVVKMSDGVSTCNYLGRFSCEKQAFEVYKKAKEGYIKEVANLYINKIPKEVYQKMMKYEVSSVG